MSQQYRERSFKRYSELISYLLVAEQNNELLMKNHNSHLTDITTFPEANTTIFHESVSISEINATFNGQNGDRSHSRGHDRCS